MAIQGLGTSIQGYHLAFCRIGDASWTALDGTLFPYRDLVYFSDHQLFYALSRYGLEAWDLRDPASPKSSLIIESLPKSREKITLFKYAYLAVSSSDLLMVNRFVSNDEPSYTVSFDVYKLDFLRKEWVYLSSLGDRVLFVGENYHSSESFSAHDFPAGTLIPNSIYFTPVDINDHYVAGNELGFFNLEDKIIYCCPFFKKRNQEVQPSPAWIDCASAVKLS
ncbi:putative F-box protein At5g55150 [Cornus florida]|uniref:putative F-box protein At5g55150 n=1 Tax=Cornus florida TaxID=4283 RepID=UPI0028A2B8A8|nr:putative F-box protein At5g55150 [Cornus florida]